MFLDCSQTQYFSNFIRHVFGDMYIIVHVRLQFLDVYINVHVKLALFSACKA